MPTARGPDPALEEHFLGALYRGGELLASGKIIEAREHLEKAHELEPRNEKAQNLLGLTYFKLGLFDLAARVYEQLVVENPADPTLRVNLGLVHLKTSDLERSTREFETAIDLDPGHKKAHNYLGLALAQKGDYARAKEHFLLAGSEPMAEKMERVLEAKGTISATTDLQVSPLPAEPPARPMPPVATPEGAELPPPPADHLDLGGALSGEPSGPHPAAAAAAAAAVEPPQHVEPPHHVELTPPSLTSDWGTHVPEQPQSVPEFVIEERPLAGPPVEPPFAHDDATPAFSMNDAPLVHLEAPLEPLEMRVESLPPAFEPIPADEAPAQALAPSQAESSMWLTEHVADVPLSSDSPATPGAWTSPPWIDSESLAAESPQWTQAQAAAGTGWMTELSSQREDPRWPTDAEGGPTWQSDSAAEVPPAHSQEPAPGSGDQSWTTEAGVQASEAPTPPEPAPDESNWVMQPVSEAFAPHGHQGVGTQAWTASLPPPAPSGFASMPSQRLAELGNASSWAHEATADPFQLGPAGLAVTVAGEMLMRTEGLVAVVGGLTVTPEPRRRRGRPTMEPFGEGPSQLHRVAGHGVVYLEGNQGFHSLDLSDQPSTAVDDGGAYVQEELVFAFEEAVSFDNGRLSDETGRWIALVHLEGRGRVLLKLPGALQAMPIPPGTPTMVPVSRLVGWFGRVTPRLVGFGGQGAVELTGEGFALLLT